MKKLLVLALLAATMNASAESARQPMLVQGKMWEYVYHHFEDQESDSPKETQWMVYYKLQGDTVIDGRQYMKMYRGDWNGNHRYYGAFREDEEGLVWQYDYEGDKKDFMICDYTCMHYPGPWPEIAAFVDVVNINGRLLHRHNWNGMLGVEGVGMAGKGLVHYQLAELPTCICDYESFAGVSGGGIWFEASQFFDPKYIELTQEEKQLVEQNNDFAFDLFRKVAGKENTILSPLSVTYALGMLNNGAAGQTQQEISQVLGFDDVDGQNAFCQKLKQELAGTRLYDQTTNVLISNTMFVNEGLGWKLKPEFTQKASQYYTANPQARDFRDGQTRNVINQWASDHTAGMIKEVLSEDEYNPMAVSYLLNAIYFKGAWTDPFKPENTHEAPFNGGELVPMMSKNEMLVYAENELCQSVTLPYGNRTYNMQVLLPREGKTLADLVGSLDGKNWQMWGTPCDVDLMLPRFKTDSSIDLRTTMKELGMPTAFSRFEADFTNLVEDMQGENIYIEMMKQVAKIEVNEQGTEAAAVTIVGEATEAMPRQVTFRADRPFLYIISEQSTGVILFIGQYTGATTTSIAGNKLASTGSDAYVYDLQGRRVTHPQKGLYIVNGRKVVR
ncbi:MAG: serpin family protein [Prevotella sp.]|nr:serpin family protein [Prevotella sp.]